MTANEVVVSLSSLGQSANYIHQALEPVCQAAETEIDMTLGRIGDLLIHEPDQHLGNWSMRISQWGIELVSCTLAEWLQGDDWCYPGYLHEFVRTDTLKWLQSNIIDNRESLRSMLVAYVMREAGYGLTAYSKSFEDALTRSAPTEPISFGLTV